MHRAGLEPVVAGLSALRAARWLILLCLLRAPAAAAFHSGAQFDDPPGKGGGGGLFYTGAPSERGWDCSACHIQPEGKIRVNLTTTPAGLVQSATYSPGVAYQLNLGLAGEHRGLSSGRSNFNGFALFISDGQGRPAGTISGYAPEEIYQANETKIASAGKKVGTAAWTFTWTAPKAGTGAVTLYLAMVDGNGADSPPTVTQTDPFGDDVIAVKLTLKDATVATNTTPSGPLRLAPQRRVLALFSRPTLSLGGMTYEDSISWPWMAGRRHLAGRFRAALRRRHHRHRPLPQRHLQRHG